MKTAHLFRVFFLTLALVFGAGIVHAEDLGAVKARMNQRLGSLAALKASGKAGEDNRGYVAARAAVSGEEQRLISDENADRRTVYTEIARKNNADPEQVGRARAQKLAAEARRGEWIQGPDGSWAQKG
jgi:uncharacterized protein YdbL (DUF1318 family)